MVAAGAGETAQGLVTAEPNEAHWRDIVKRRPWVAGAAAVALVTGATVGAVEAIGTSSSPTVYTVVKDPCNAVQGSAFEPLGKGELQPPDTGSFQSCITEFPPGSGVIAERTWEYVVGNVTYSVMAAVQRDQEAATWTFDKDEDSALASYDQAQLAWLFGGYDQQPQHYKNVGKTVVTATNGHSFNAEVLTDPQPGQYAQATPKPRAIMLQVNSGRPDAYDIVVTDFASNRFGDFQKPEQQALVANIADQLLTPAPTQQ